MKNQTKKVLQKTGVILAMVMIFTMLAVPAWATGESNSGGDTTVPGAGAPYVSAYTVTDAAGNELQRIEEGQKCRIIIAVVDPRISVSTTKPDPNDPAKTINKTPEEIAADKANWLTPANGTPLAANVKVTSTASFASPSLGDISTTTFTADKITSNGLEYAIILNDITYLGGDNKLSLDLSYNNYALQLSTITQPISQCVGSSTEGAKASALVVTSASYGGGSINAGSDFALTVDVLASGGTVGAENVAVNLALPEQITVASGSTNIFVGNMKPGASTQVTFQLNASAVANGGSYNITVNVSGNSASDSAALTAQMPVTVPIVQPERFEISRTDFPEYLSMGEEGHASVSFVNKGKGIIYNVSAEITGDGITTTEGNQFIGNIAAGTESSADFTIQTANAGTLTGLLTVTYEDEKGNAKTLTKEFSMTVEEMQMGGGDTMGGGMDTMVPMEPEPTGVPVWVWSVVGVGVVAAVVVVLVVLKKKKAKRRAAQLMEDDDEDI